MNKANRFLRDLVCMGMCTVNESTHGTAITIVNYGKFQDVGASNGVTESVTDG